MSGQLFLLPVPLADGTAAAVLPAATLDAARGIDYFLAENAKSARAFLKEIGHPKPIATLRIMEIGHHPDPKAIAGWLAPVAAGTTCAIVSEAGCPGVADPGAEIVAQAHRLGIVVRPLVGPSSLLLALMASGMNGQAFRFVGYLPQDAAALTARLRELERHARAGETQLWIETPYRNDRMRDAVLACCAADTRFLIAADLTAGAETVRALPVAAWKAKAATSLPVLHKRPAVFGLLGPGR